MNAEQRQAPAARVRFSLRSIGVPWDMLLLWAFWAGLAVLHTAVLGAPGALRLLVALPALLFFPGYALAAVLFPNRGQLIWVERAGLSLVFSIATIVFACLLLYALELPIERLNLLIALGLASAVLSLAVLLRRAIPTTDDRRPATGEAAKRRSFAASALLLGSNGWQNRLTALAIALLLTAGLGAVGYALLTAAPGERYTEFAAVGAQSGAADPPLTIGASDTYSLTVTVRNQEQRARAYELRLAGDQGYAERIAIGTLEDGAAWSQVLRVPTRAPAPLHELRLELFVADDTAQPYRELHLWLQP